MSYEEFEEYYEEATSHVEAAQRNRRLREVISQCVFRDEDCILLAHLGYCDDFTAKDEHWMSRNCCPICHSTSQLEFLHRCPLDPNAYKAYSQPGDVSKKFMSLLKKMEPEYSVQVHAAPMDIPGVAYEYKVVPNDAPWVVTIDNFVTTEEMHTLLEHANVYGYERSTDGLDEDEDGSWEAGETEERTSYEAWCGKRHGCVDDPIVLRVMDRLEEAVDIPQSHSDRLQLLRYEVGQFYRVHQDYHSYQAFSQTGARVLTALMYLSDVEEGGETRFPYLDVNIQPKKGRVLIWSNVLDGQPDEEALLARHEALPVVRGEKYAATAWFHARDYRSAPKHCGR